MKRNIENYSESIRSSYKRCCAALLMLIMTALLFLCGCSTEDTPGTADGGDAVNTDGQIVELDYDSSVTQEGDYKIEGMLTDILSDEIVADGWVYYYSEGTQDIVEMTEWEKADDMYTSCEIAFTMTNLQEKMTESFTERAKAAVLFDFPEDFDRTKALDDEYAAKVAETENSSCQPEIFPMTVLQDNPGQTNPDGYQARSKDAVLLSEGESARIWMVADVSERFLRSWEDDSADETMWAYFSFGDGAVYAVNLREYLAASDI